MYDYNLAFASSVTTTTHYTGSSVSIPTGTPRRGLKARVICTSLTGTSPTWLPFVEEATDSAATAWTTLAYPIGALDTQTATGEVFISFESSAPAFRLRVNIGGTAPQAIFTSDIGIARP